MLKSRIYKYFLPLPLVMLSACGDYKNTGNSVVATGSSEFIHAEVIDDINTSTMLQVVKAKIDANATNAFGYKAVKIVYKTKGQNDEDINASGLLVIPTASDAYQAYRVSQGENPFSVSMLCDNHGTIFTNSEAPSNVEVHDGLPNYSLAVLMAGYAGFAAILPDYIGYGESNDKKHPYLLKKASARASEDMIKASIKYMEDEGVMLNYQLYISGYSQGGYNAMALAEKVEEGLRENINLMGVAPMAGPHLLKPFGDAVLQTGANMSVPAFMAYLADAYADSYDDLNLSEMVLDSKIATFDELFDGSNDVVAIHTKLGLPLGAPTSALFKSEYISDYETNASHPLKVRLSENSVGNWNATSKIKLIHCSNDDVVPSTMSVGVKQLLESYGSSHVEILLIDGVEANASAGESIHGNCALPAYQQAIGWFNALRNGEL